MMRALLCASLATLARGHGAMTFPKPRQALDGALAPWSGWAYPCDERHENGSCIITFCEDGTECQGSTWVRHDAHQIRPAQWTPRWSTIRTEVPAHHLGRTRHS
jgi:hypothetical protein